MGHPQAVTAEQATGVAVGDTGLVGHGLADAQGAAGAVSDEPLGERDQDSETQQADGEERQIPVGDAQRVAEGCGGSCNQRPFYQQQQGSNAKLED